MEVMHAGRHNQVVLVVIGYQITAIQEPVKLLKTLTNSYIQIISFWEQYPVQSKLILMKVQTFRQIQHQWIFNTTVICLRWIVCKRSKWNIYNIDMIVKKKQGYLLYQFSKACTYYGYLVIVNLTCVQYLASLNLNTMGSFCLAGLKFLWNVYPRNYMYMFLESWPKMEQILMGNFLGQQTC